MIKVGSEELSCVVGGCHGIYPGTDSNETLLNIIRSSNVLNRIDILAFLYRHGNLKTMKLVEQRRL